MIGSLSQLLHARYVIDSLLRKLNSSGQDSPSKEESIHARSTVPLVRCGKPLSEAENLGRSRARDAKNRHRPSIQADQQGGLSDPTGGKQ